MAELEAPTGWHWGLGNSSDSHYTYWLYSDETFELPASEKNRSDGAVEWGYEIEQYWDDGQSHSVIASKTYYDADGDIVHTERVKSEQFDSKNEATQEVIRIADGLL